MKRTAILQVSAIVAGVLLACGLFFLSGALYPSAGPGVQDPSSAPGGYILREYDGKLAVFEPGQGEPSRILEMEVQLLPPYDQGLLRAGIEVPSAAELNRLLEDYTS